MNKTESNRSTVNSKIESSERTTCMEMRTILYFIGDIHRTNTVKESFQMLQVMDV